MKAWQDIQLQLQRQNITFGNTFNIQGVLMDSYTSEFIIMVEGVIGTAAATACIEGLPAILSKVNINGPLTGYTPLTPINGVSGGMLSDISQFIRRNVSYSWGSLGSTGKFGVSIPCTFIRPRLGWPNCYMSVLPTKLMGSVNFNVLVASQAQLDTNATATLAFTNLTVYVQQNEYRKDTIPNMAPAGTAKEGLWSFIPNSINYATNQNIQASQQTQQLFPNGTYTLIVVRSFPTAPNGVPTSRQSDTVAGGPIDLGLTSAGLIVQDVNQAPKNAVQWGTLRKENLDNVTDALVTGNVAFEWNQGLSKIFQPSIGPNQIPLNYATTLTGTTSPLINFVYDQIYDTGNVLGLQ